MAEDIKFYDFDFNLLYVLPPSSENGGYISINVTAEYNGNGSLEIEFYNDELKSIIEQNRDNVFVVWKEFQGFITSYMWLEKKYRVFGMSLNGLLHRGTFYNVKQAWADRNVENFALAMLSLSVTWMKRITTGNFTKIVSYSRDKMDYLDIVVQEVLDLDNAGYKVYADFTNKQFVFKCIKYNENGLIISSSNLNGQGFKTTYDNKELAFSGYFLSETDGKPYYVMLDRSKEGTVKNIAIPLEATTESTARLELRRKKAEHTLEAELCNLKYGQDYFLGDKIKIQEDHTTVIKVVTGVIMSQEKTYREEPKFSDVED